MPSWEKLQIGFTFEAFPLSKTALPKREKLTTIARMIKWKPSSDSFCKFCKLSCKTCVFGKVVRIKKKDRIDLKKTEQLEITKKNEEEEEDKTLTGLENKILEPGTSRVKMSNREPQWFIWNFCSKLRIN